MNINIKKAKDVIEVVRVFISCCILHNFLHVSGELPHGFYEEIIDDVIDEDDPEFNGTLSHVNGDRDSIDSRRRSIFDFIMDYLI